MSPCRDDEHLSVPTWRMRQLQDIEHAARECVELLPKVMHDADPAQAAQLAVVYDLLHEALGND